MEFLTGLLLVLYIVRLSIKSHPNVAEAKLKISSTITSYEGINNCFVKTLTFSWRRPLSYRNQSIDLLRRWMDWFLYDNGLRHERVKNTLSNSNLLSYNHQGFCKHFLDVSALYFHQRQKLEQSLIFLFYQLLFHMSLCRKSSLVSS